MSRCGPVLAAEHAPHRLGVGGRRRRPAGRRASPGSTPARRGRRCSAAPRPSAPARGPWTAPWSTARRGRRAPCTTMARGAPLAPSTPSIVSAMAGSLTPTTCRRARAGLASGPRKLNTVGTPSSRAHRAGVAHGRVEARARSRSRCPPRRCSGPHRPGPRSMTTPSASSTSADPAADEAARFAVLAHPHAGPGHDERGDGRHVDHRLRSPPVPQVSTSVARRAPHGSACGQHGGDQPGQLVDRLALGRAAP